MKSSGLKFLFFFLFSLSFLSAEEATSNKQEDFNVEKISEALGYLVGENLEQMGLVYDLKSFAKGLQDASSKDSSLATKEKCHRALSLYLQKAYWTLGQKNLQIAEDFFSKNCKEKEIISLIPGKLQYKILKSGKGPSLESYNSPLVRYSAKYLDGSIFAFSEEAEVVSIQEMFPALQNGMNGMKEGEIRTLYIHPELTKTLKGSVAPNALLTFEIELLSADRSKLPKPKEVLHSEVANETHPR
jgi:peptidylprolyl isomerase